MGFFGPSKKEIWSQVAEQINGNFIDGGFFGRDALRYRSQNWQITLDTYTQSSGDSQTTYTRMRAPFKNKDNFYFKIYRKTLFSGLGKSLLGMQDIIIGDPQFDEDFILKSNNPETLRLLLQDVRIKQYFNSLRRVSLEIKEDEGFWGTDFPEGTDELYFRCVGVIKDPVQLKTLFDLFALTLERLVRIDSAYDDDPGVILT